MFSTQNLAKLLIGIVTLGSLTSYAEAPMSHCSGSQYSLTSYIDFSNRITNIKKDGVTIYNDFSSNDSLHVEAQTLDVTLNIYIISNGNKTINLKLVTLITEVNAPRNTFVGLNGVAVLTDLNTNVKEVLNCFGL